MRTACIHPFPIFFLCSQWKQSPLWPGLIPPRVSKSHPWSPDLQWLSVYLVQTSAFVCLINEYDLDDQAPLALLPPYTFHLSNMEVLSFLKHVSSCPCVHPCSSSPTLGMHPHLPPPSPINFSMSCSYFKCKLPHLSGGPLLVLQPEQTSLPLYPCIILCIILFWCFL